jgi:ABC-2 type transport system permease protein
VIGHLWRRHRVVLLLLVAGIGLFEWILTRVAPAAVESGLLQTMLQLAPEPVRAAIGEELTTALGPRGILGFGYVHPFPMLLASIWVVRVSAASLAGEIGSGTMDLMASQPVPRGRLVLAPLFALAAGLGLLMVAAWTGTAVGVLISPIEGVRATAFLPVAATCWLLFLGFGGVALWISSSSRAGGVAIARSSAFIAASFVLDYLSRVWGPMEPLRPLSLFSYYRPTAILNGAVEARSILVLGAVALAGTLLALTTFGRRDL